MLVSAEAGAAWTLLYPWFQVVIPEPVTASVPLAFPTADERLASFLSHCIELERKAASMRRLYDHWILGLSAEPKQPRWCIARDLLGWMD